MSATAILALADGTVFEGVALGALTTSVGEVVFNTSMTGYQEILTDPSYAGQFVVLTSPQIGNVGVNDEDEESSCIYAAGVIVRALPRRRSNWRASGDLDHYLTKAGVPGIADLDTRKLTRVLRERGAQNGCLISGGIGAHRDEAVERARAFPGLKGMNLIQDVSTKNPYRWSKGPWTIPPSVFLPPTPPCKVAVYDFGVKRTILRQLVAQGCDVWVFPANTEAPSLLEEGFDGVVLSNGPGDPEACDKAVAAVRTLLKERMPLLGICLGHQLIALACGARTVKMPLGHHGGNHPVKDVTTGKVFITSQNHGFTVLEKSLPSSIRITHRSLFDGTIQGLMCLDRPALTFQGHPEAAPGPQDVAPLFRRFRALMLTRKR